MLNKQKGNMYGFVSHTWNTVKGKCPHDCTYCYMKMFPQGKVRFDEKELKTDLGSDNYIFVGSSCDMFAEDIPREWIMKTLEHCAKHPKNKYLFQSKNPTKMFTYKDYIPQTSVIGTTIESNRCYKEMGLTPSVELRATAMGYFKRQGFETMVTIEPVMDFDLEDLVRLIRLCSPTWVNIGADSKNHHLPEPDPKKLKELIDELKKFTEIKNKANLKRIIGDIK